MADPYREALQTLVGLGAERVLVLQGPDPMQPRLLHGFDEQAQWRDQVSLGVLQRSFQGEPLLVGDVRSSPLAERWSVQVSGVCSLVCVPFWSPSSRILGLLYADTKKAFTRETMTAMQRCARKLEQALYGTAPLAEATSVAAKPAALPGRKLGLKPAEGRPPAPGVKSPARPAKWVGLSPSRSRSLAVSLRSLSTMVRAGLPIERALQVLAQHESDARLRQAAESIHASVCGGRPLALAMAASRIFPPFECSLVEVGERTGSLDRVLEQLAEVREKWCQTQLRLQSTLAYPLLLSAFSLLALLLAPPFVLKGQFELLRQSGQQPPLLTQAVMTLSQWPVLLSLALLLGVAIGWGRRHLGQQHALKIPPLRTLLTHLGAARLAHSLAITYRVGVPITEGLGLAVRASGASWLERDLPQALVALKQGEKMSTVIGQFSDLPASFRALVGAGEECGKLDSTLAWVARFFECEFETQLESLMSLLQPLLILLMGSVVGLLLLATLLPMVSLVQGL